MSLNLRADVTGMHDIIVGFNDQHGHAGLRDLSTAHALPRDDLFCILWQPISTLIKRDSRMLTLNLKIALLFLNFCLGITHRKISKMMTFVGGN